MLAILPPPLSFVAQPMRAQANTGVTMRIYRRRFEMSASVGSYARQTVGNRRSTV